MMDLVISDLKFGYQIFFGFDISDGARELARVGNFGRDGQRVDQSCGGGRRNWNGEKSLRTPLAAWRIDSANFGVVSSVRTASMRVAATARRRLVVNFDASVRARPCDCGPAAGAAETARSAHSAVATTITAITCLVRRIVWDLDRPEY